MPDESPLIDAESPPRFLALTTETRIAIVLIGVAMPYLARVPGIYYCRPDWLTQYLDTGILGAAVICVSNAFNWGLVLAVTCYFRSARAIAIVAAIGFALPLFGHATLDLRSDALSAIAIPMFPILALPLVGIGWLVGHLVDRKFKRSIIISPSDDTLATSPSWKHRGS